VVQELRGEKIDIVPWDPDPAKFVCNALAPAEILRVIVDEDNRSMEVVVPEDQLSLAIGKKGQNVRLASRLTNWKLDVISESEYNRELKEGYKSLLKLSGVGEKLATALYEMGFRSSEDIAKSEAADLATVKGISERKAQELIEEASSYIEKEGTKREVAMDGEELFGGVDE
jgi:N utilization substance protein A